jgi:hypothetical protein
MRFVIKSVGPSGEMWLVRMAGRGVWGGQVRARTFINRASAESCLGKLRTTAEPSLEVVAFGESSNTTSECKSPAEADVA